VAAVQVVFPEVANGHRTFAQQGAFQFAALCTSLGIAILGGAFTGFIAQFIGRPPKYLFEDIEHFREVEYDFPHKHVPAEEDERESENEKIGKIQPDE